MEVKDVFELRKQGKLEEAYAAIRPMYAVHKGKYTTLAMFWTASDILKKRLDEQRGEEACKIFEALLRVLPSIDDRDGKGHAAVMSAAVRLGRECKTFSIIDFLESYGMEHLTEADWQAVTPTVNEGESPAKRFPLPSTAMRMLTLAFHEIQDEPSVDRALKVTPLLQEALKRQPYNKNAQRYMAIVYGIMGEREKAIAIYKRLLSRCHDSWLYAELSALTEDDGERAALMCQAITHQRQEQFRSGYHLQLAQLLLGRDNSRAAYELERCIAIRQKQGFHNTREINDLQKALAGVQPVSAVSQQDFYRRMAQKYINPNG
ncbi:MAG: acetyltransferase [Prevotella sp.]|nr:acetyltransferase [Prevotella sp.]